MEAFQNPGQLALRCLIPFTRRDPRSLLASPTPATIEAMSDGPSSLRRMKDLFYLSPYPISIKLKVEIPACSPCKTSQVFPRPGRNPSLSIQYHFYFQHRENLPLFQ